MTQHTRPPTWTCATCRGEFHHPPTIHVGVVFCCAGCVAGGPCICSYDDEPAFVESEAPETREFVLVD